jgi:hypothetical protein
MIHRLSEPIPAKNSFLREQKCENEAQNQNEQDEENRGGRADRAAAAKQAQCSGRAGP